MVSARRRLQNLEARVADPGGASRVPPVEVRVLLRAVERHRTAEAGEEVPSYAAEEVEAMYREDLEIADGGGIVGEMRGSPEAAWSSPEAEAILGEWEEGARRRLERIRGGESPDAVYNDQDNPKE